MAHPGYPHGPNPYPPAAPAQPPPAAAPRRKGTSKAVPIVFSIALAGGTFAGLTLALGTGAKKDDAAETGKVATTPDAGVVAVAPPDAAPPPTPPIDAAPAPAKATLTIEVTPPDAKVKITVDGKEVTGPVEIELDKTGQKTVKVVAKASGYRTYEEKVTVEGNETLAIKLRKRSSGGGSGDSGGSGRGSNDNVIDL